jgi:hypothetical protein
LGPDNLFRIVDALEEELPSHVHPHLFGGDRPLSPAAKQVPSFSSDKRDY